MNYYVGRLLLSSSSAPIALFFGWHTWSILRGIGYTRIVYDASSFSLERLTGVTLTTRTRRVRRWRFAILFLCLDGLLKFCALEPVRRILEANLLTR